MKKVRVLLADDHKMLREGLRLLVNGQRDMRVIGEAADGQEAMQKARELKPDVVVMDLSMPKVNGLQATERLRQDQPAVKVVALTVHEDASYLVQLCKAGASGYVLKRSAGDDLIQAIRDVSRGAAHFDPTLASKALAARPADNPARAGLRPAHLSDREREILTLLAWGYSNKEIANRLKLSVKTVETYRLRVGEKLGLRSRTEMVRYALRQGWLNESYPLVPGSR